MKLLLDQGLPRSAASILRERQTETVHVGELDMATASDEAIIRYARDHGFSIVTLDADFHSLLALSGAKGPSVIRIRIQGLKGQEVASLISTVLDRLPHEIESGGIVTVTPDSIRLRRLPISHSR